MAHGTMTDFPSKPNRIPRRNAGVPRLGCGWGTARSAARRRARARRAWSRCGAATRPRAAAGYALHLALALPIRAAVADRTACARAPALSRHRRHLSGGEPHAARRLRSARDPRAGLRRSPQVAAARRLAGSRIPAAQGFRRRQPLPTEPTTAIRSSRSKAKACTRSRSARCTPAPSSRGTSASPSSAKRSCAWRSGWATSTRASRSASSR